MFSELHKKDNRTGRSKFLKRNKKRAGFCQRVMF